MPLNLSSLAQLRPIQAPDQIKRLQTLQALQTGQLQQQQVQAELNAQQTAAQQQAELQAILSDPAAFDANGQVSAVTLQKIYAKNPKLAESLQTSYANMADKRAGREHDTAVHEETKSKNAAEQLLARQKFEFEQSKPTEVTAGATLVPPTQQLPYTAPKEPTPLAPRTIRTSEGVMQHNPATGKFDIKVGDLPPTSSIDPVVPVHTINDKGDPVVRFPTRSQVAGKEFPEQPTAQERNYETSLGKIDPVMSSISELSEKINTQKGVIAKLSGAAEKAKAQINLNDDVAEYEALISGFTPMVARAVGHTGVLTQQDVDSVRALFPKPGDSKSLRDRKIARVKMILGAVKGDTPQPTARPRASDGKGNFVEWNGKAWVPVKP